MELHRNFELVSVPKLVVDSSLHRFSTVYATAGNDHSAVSFTVDLPLALTAGEEADFCKFLYGGEGT